MSVVNCTSCNSELVLDDSITEEEEDEDQHIAKATNNERAASTLGQRTMMQGNLFDLIADAQRPLDVPMCQECATALLYCLDDQLAAAEQECIEYNKVLSNLKHQSKSSIDNAQKKHDLRQAELEDESLRSQIEDLLLQEQALDEQIKAVDEERDDQAKKLDELYYQYRDMSQALVDLDDERRSLRAREKYAQKELLTLESVNVLNMAFHIWIDGPYGVINGQRLGRMYDPAEVEWHEINSAFGHAAALLEALATKFKVSFKSYEPVSMFSNSYMRVLGDDVNSDESDSHSIATNSSAATSHINESTLHPLYSSGGAKLIGDTKFDAGIVAFIDCLAQLQLNIKEKLLFADFPYVLTKDKITDQKQNRSYCVRTQFNSGERWTKAMKYMLINMKYALAYVERKKAR